MNLFVLRHHGIALRGPPPTDVFPDVTMAAMRAASLRSLHEEWEPLLEDHAKLSHPHQQASVTLTLCRILHTARKDAITSKREASAWVKRTHPRWRGLVRRAEAWRHGLPLDLSDEILAFLQFVIDETARRAPAP